MDSRAVKRYTNTSPRKMMLVADLIRGKNVEDALSILHFSTKHASRVCEKTLRSAVANLQQKEETTRVTPDQLYVKEVFVDQAPTMRRMLPAPMGRAFRMRKRSHHLTMIIEDESSRKKRKGNK